MFDPLRALVALALVLAGPEAAPAGLLVRGGEVLDGSGAPSRRRDVRISGDVIVEIGPGLVPRPGERVLEAADRVVAPGFIDLHSHAGGGLDRAPDAASQLRQGITTVLVGMDGGGELPVGEFLERLDRLRPAISLATFVGHGTVRGLVLGGDFRRAATPAEVEVMKALVDRGMKDGALGLSSGLEYDPGFFADPAELQALAAVAARHGGVYASHVRDEEVRAMEAFREAVEVARKAGLPVSISHIKLAAQPVWGRAAEALRILEDARRDGLQVWADWYPYTYWQSSLYLLNPDRDFADRAKWQAGLEQIGGGQNIMVTGYDPDPSWNGKDLATLAREQGQDVVSLILGMIDKAGPRIGVIGTAMKEPDLERFFAHPQVLICSDGALAGRHPRGYNAFPRVLARYVREKKLVSLPEAVAKMTGRSAAFAGLADRGLLAVGRKADLVVFDAERIEDHGTPAEPSRPPTGIDYVIVNGEVALEKGEPTSARAGRALRRGRSPGRGQ
jgi:N-acyl-D-amino-acid deacylase